MHEASPPIEFTPRGKLLALAVIAGLCEGIVWAGNALGWVGAVLVAILCGTLALTIGGVVGVPLVPAFRSLTTLVGVFEGIVWGLAHHGWPGALMGIVVGFLAGHVAGLLALTLLVLVFLCFPSVRAALREARALEDSRVDGS